MIVCSALIITACTGRNGFRQTENGVIVNVADGDNSKGKVVRIQPVNSTIIRVSASPESEIRERKSLIVAPELKTGFDDYTVSRKDDSVIVATNIIKAVVSLKNGAVRFADQNGATILSEKNGGGKSFSPIRIDNTSGYSFRQVFESECDDAFYGLGQHQSDEWNYKDKNEELFQYNTKVSIPFVISNKKYGIIWDNYSFSRFGDARPYSQISDFRLTDMNGAEGGLSATYTTADGKIFAMRTEKVIDYENLETIRNFPPCFPFDSSTVTWEGDLTANETGEHKFRIYYAGYTIIYIDGHQVGDEIWRTAWNPNTRKFNVKMEAGKPTHIKIEWKPDGCNSYIGLKCLSPLPDSECNQMSIWSEMGQMIDYYFVYGETTDKIISGYRTITGKAPILPKWAWGFWQSRERYKTQDEIVGTLKEFRKRHIPIDNIVMDWSYWEEDQWGSHEFDSERFSDPKKMVSDIHDMNGHIMISVWPKFYLNTTHYKEFDSHGWIYKQAINDSIRDWIAQGYYGSFYDAYNPDARNLFWSQMNEHLFSLGIDAWWMDASEPDIQSNASMDYRKKLTGPTAIGSSTEFFNTYALVNAQGIYEGQRSVSPDQRVFLLTRSGFLGLQRYGTATWSGDIGTRWEDMKAQIPAGMNYSMSGTPYWTMDIGGFCVEKRYVIAQCEFDKKGIENEDLKEWRELNARWHQFGAFVPLYRTHGQFPYREIFNLAPENHPAYKSVLYYHKMRYSLMPYIYSLAAKVYFDDYTIMRPLVMDFYADNNVLNISDQFMFGPSIMVNPVCRYKATSRDVYFPKCAGWYNLYDGSFLKGGQKLAVDAPYERIPLFVKAGSILPVGPDIEYTGQKDGEPITLFVYAGADAEFMLYNDEGVNYNYEKGEFAKVRFKYSEAGKTLTIDDREGRYKAMPQKMTFNIVFVEDGKPTVFGYVTKADKVIEYNGEKVVINL